MTGRIRDYQTVIRAVEEAARTLPGLRIEDAAPIEAPSGRYPFFHLTLRGIRSGQPGNRPIYIGGGIHGDEPGGVWAALEFLRRYPHLPECYRHFDFTLLPCVNPFGFEHDMRENAAGIDLNRQFRSPAPPPEVDRVKAAAGARPFHAALEFHEDVDTPGFYLYELTRDGEASWGAEILSRVEKRFPVNKSDEIEGAPAEGGLIYRGDGDGEFRNMVERRSDWPQAFHHFANGSRRCYTTETPVFLLPEERAEIHLLALDTVIQKLWAASLR
ncbi:MAG TPA: M14 family metallocarboxypeptidase [Nitrospiria bacterium]